MNSAPVSRSRRQFSSRELSRVGVSVKNISAAALRGADEEEGSTTFYTCYSYVNIFAVARRYLINCSWNSYQSCLILIARVIGIPAISLSLSLSTTPRLISTVEILRRPKDSDIDIFRYRRQTRTRGRQPHKGTTRRCVAIISLPPAEAGEQ
jgi:hypothetical protein